MKAWYCNTNDNMFPSIVFTKTREKAMAHMENAARDACYDYTYTDIIAIRAPEYDCLASTHGELRPHVCMPPEQLASLLLGEEA